jgi:hypothetical protein
MKNVLLALAIGYVIGAKSNRDDLEQLGRSVTSLLATDEFADVVTSARSQVGSSLRELASRVEGEHHVTEAGGDLVARVRSLMGPA